MFTHPNPQVRRMHEKHGKPEGKAEAKPEMKPQPEGMETEEKGHVEIHKGPPSDGTMPEAGYHTVHHPGGEMKGHASLHDAHHAANDHMGEDGCMGADCDDHGQGGGGGLEAAAEGSEY